MTDMIEKPKKLAPPELPRNKITEWVTLEDGIRMRASSHWLEDAEAWVAKVRAPTRRYEVRTI